MSKLFTPNMYYWIYWSRKTLVTIHWMAFCATSFCPPKIITYQVRPHLFCRRTSERNYEAIFRWRFRSRTVLNEFTVLTSISSCCSRFHLSMTLSGKKKRLISRLHLGFWIFAVWPLVLVNKLVAKNWLNGVTYKPRYIRKTLSRSARFLLFSRAITPSVPITERCSLRDTLAAILPYLMFINDVTMTIIKIKFTPYTQN